MEKRDVNIVNLFCFTLRNAILEWGESFMQSYPSCIFLELEVVATPLWRKCEVATHTPENESLESFGTPKILEDDCRGQNPLHWSVLYTIGKVLKCRCPKWPHMSHLDIYSPSYGQKKG
jgi:hypothetical protein